MPLTFRKIKAIHGQGTELAYEDSHGAVVGRKDPRQARIQMYGALAPFLDAAVDVLGFPALWKNNAKCVQVDRKTTSPDGPSQFKIHCIKHFEGGTRFDFAVSGLTIDQMKTIKAAEAALDLEAEMLAFIEGDTGATAPGLFDGQEYVEVTKELELKDEADTILEPGDRFELVEKKRGRGGWVVKLEGEETATIPRAYGRLIDPDVDADDEDE